MLDLQRKSQAYTVVDFSEAFDKCRLVLMTCLTIRQYGLYCVHHDQQNQTWKP